MNVATAAKRWAVYINLFALPSGDGSYGEAIGRLAAVATTGRLSKLDLAAILAEILEW
ncbi:MAG: hypothetical protein KDA72_23075 [Planctomycetales bacterium]|nr:hypothetical protein [Planctomycetales bacterium]